MSEAKPVSSAVTPNKSSSDITKAESKSTKPPSASGISGKEEAKEES